MSSTALREVFNASCVEYIATQLATVHPPFNATLFTAGILHQYEPLGFSQRLERIISALETHLPTAFEQSAPLLIAALGDEIDDAELTGYDGFYIMPLSLYIARHGQSHFNLSMHALTEMTKRFTAEFAIRYFLLSHPKQTLAYLASIASDKNPHVRRLVSEGTRPRLPMSIRLQPFIKEPSAVLHLLEQLKNEPTRLVQRSIANSLNDIGKDHPNAVTSLLARWQVEGVKDIHWIAPHALRTLIKTGNSEALALLGYAQDIDITVSLEIAQPTLSLGQSLEFTLAITSNIPRSVRLMIDFVIGFKKANGSLSPKVFKLSKKELAAHEQVCIVKKHPIRKATTRMHYEGEHSLQVQINGKLFHPPVSFTLKLPKGDEALLTL